MSLLKKAIDILEMEGKLPDEYRPHKLTNKKGNVCNVYALEVKFKGE